MKAGNGFTAADLVLFYADSASGCSAPGHQVALNNGDRGEFTIDSLPPGATMTYYFCQRGKKRDGTYVWGPAVAATGTVGNAQPNGSNSEIPAFNVSVDPRVSTVTVSWTPPGGISVRETSVWIEGMEANTKLRFSGPMKSVTVFGLQPVHEYVAVVGVETTTGAYRQAQKTFRTGESTENINATLTGTTACPDGQTCGLMTLTASHAAQFQPRLTLVCVVETGRPAQQTELRFSQGAPSVAGILTEAVSEQELKDKQVVKSCRTE